MLCSLVERPEFYALLDGQVIDDAKIFSDKLRECVAITERIRRLIRHPGGGGQPDRSTARWCACAVFE